MYLCLTCKADQACLNYCALEAKHGYDVPCPSEGCGGLLLEIDDGIGEAIAILNDKGYTTVDSCSGHFNNCHGLLTCYVVFEQRKMPSTKNLPDGFAYMLGDGVTIQGDSIMAFDGNDEVPAAFFGPGNRTLQVFEANRKLLEWVLTLPPRERA